MSLTLRGRPVEDAHVDASGAVEDACFDEAFWADTGERLDDADLAALGDEYPEELEAAWHDCQIMRAESAAEGYER